MPCLGLLDANPPLPPFTSTNRGSQPKASSVERRHHRPSVHAHNHQQAHSLVPHGLQCQGASLPKQHTFPSFRPPHKCQSVAPSLNATWPTSEMPHPVHYTRVLGRTARAAHAHHPPPSMPSICQFNAFHTHSHMHSLPITCPPPRLGPPPEQTAPGVCPPIPSLAPPPRRSAHPTRPAPHPRRSAACPAAGAGTGRAPTRAPPWPVEQGTRPQGLRVGWTPRTALDTGRGAA